MASRFRVGLLCVVVASSARCSSPTSPKANKPSADGVAAQLMAATDSAAMEPALQQVYEYLGVTYLRPEGPTEAEAGRFGIHDFESELLAQRFLERDRFPVDRLVRFIGDAGVIDSSTGAPMTAEALMEALSAAMAEGRGDESAFHLRLIDQLGMKRVVPLDLTRAGLDPAQTYLDSIQVFLILYDLFSGIEAAQSAGSQRESSTSTAARFTALPASGLFKFLKFLRLGGLALVSLLTTLEDAIISLGYVITLEPSSSEAHWKHEANDTGREREIKATVIWDLGPAGAKLSRWSRQLSGYSSGLPEPGKQSAVQVVWRTDPVVAPKNGALKTSEYSERTNSDGVASVTFVPKTEKMPGQGPRKFEHGTIEAQVMFRPWKSLIAGDYLKIFELLDIGPENNSAFAALNIERHQGLALEMSGKYVENAFGCCSWVREYMKTTVPLTTSDTAFVADTIWPELITFTADGCGSSTTTANFSVHIEATGLDPLHFTLTAPDTSAVVGCPGAQPSAQWFPPVNFSIPAEDGATVTYDWTKGVTFEGTPPEGSMTFKMVEDTSGQ